MKTRRRKSGRFDGQSSARELAIKFSDLYPVKWISLAGLIVGEVLFLALGRAYAFGLWYGLTVSLGLNFFLVARALKYLDHDANVDKITWKVTSAGLIRLTLYGVSLAISTLTDELNFFAVAGGLVVPALALQTTQAFTANTTGGNDA